MQTYFSYAIYIIIIVVLLQVSWFLFDHSDAFGELLVNTNNLVKNSNTLIIKNEKNVTASLANSARLLEKSDSLINTINNIILIAGENKLVEMLNDAELSKELQLTLENIRELSTLLLIQLKEQGIKLDAQVF